MQTEKAVFATYLFWTDFMYRARLQTGIAIEPKRAERWITWLETVDPKRIESRVQCGQASGAFLMLLRDLDENMHEDFNVYITRCGGSRNTWCQRWTQLLSLVLKSHAIDEVARAIMLAGGVDKDTQQTIQAFLWSAKGLEC